MAELRNINDPATAPQFVESVGAIGRFHARFEKLGTGFNFPLQKMERIADQVSPEVKIKSVTP